VRPAGNGFTIKQSKTTFLGIVVSKIGRYMTRKHKWTNSWATNTKDRKDYDYEDQLNAPVQYARTETLAVELINRRTEEGTPLFRENSITLADGSVQLMGFSANVGIFVHQYDDESGETFGK